MVFGLLSTGEKLLWNRSIGPLGTNFSEILIGIQKFLLKKMHLKMSAKWQPFGLCHDVLRKTDQWELSHVLFFFTLCHIKSILIFFL